MDLFSPYGLIGYVFMAYFASFFLSVVMITGYLLPLLQVLITNERKKWLSRHFQKTSSSGPEEDEFRRNLLVASTPIQEYPVYKFLKFYLLSVGVICLVSGLLMMVLPESMGSVGKKIIIFVPAVVGAVFYFLYKNILSGQGLWREVTGFFMLAGFTATAMGAYDLFDMHSWLRSDILIYLILSFGLFVIHHIKSTIASYVYMIIVMMGAQFVQERVGNNGLLFMTHFIWFFAVAILYFWIPKLKAAKAVEVKQIIFGVLFSYSIILLSVNNTSGLIIPALAVVLPSLYIFSKAYFSKASWFGARPIEVSVVLTIVIVTMVLSFGDVVEMANHSITLFENYSFEKQVVYLIIVAIAYGGYRIYSEMSDEEIKSLNLLIVLFPIVAFLFIYILSNNGTQFIVNLFAFYLGYDYLRRGLKNKDVTRITLGVVLLIGGLLVRLESFKEELDDRIFAGFIVFFFGAIFFGLAFYLRSQWNVTGVKDNGEGVEEIDVVSSPIVEEE